MQRSEIFVQNRVFAYPTYIRRLRYGGFPSEYRHPVWHGRTRMAWLPDCEKNFEDIFIRFDATHERDRHTHRHTHRQMPHDSIGRAYAYHRAAKTALEILYYWSNEANYWQTRSIARPLCDSRATCQNSSTSWLVRIFSYVYTTKISTSPAICCYTTLLNFKSQKCYRIFALYVTVICLPKI